MSVTLDSRRDFTLRNLERVALGGETLRIGPKARRRMLETRAAFMALLDSDRTRFIYGTTSGGGHHASKPVAPEEQRAHASRAVWRIPGWGFGGEDVPERVVRMIVFARLANYIEGHAKSRPEVAERIASMLDGPMPRLPESGQVGAGEILPLFHVMSAMPQGDYEEGEPMAVINGSPVSAGLAADVALTSRRRFALATAVFALSVEALAAPLEAYDPALARACADRHVAAVLQRLSRLLRGTTRRGRRPYQAPVSWRILPQVLGAGLRAVETMHEVAEISISSVTDNPVYLPPDSEHPLGRVYSTGGYHNAQVCPAIDAVNARYADLCTLCDHHTHRLHDPEVSGLPESLSMPAPARRTAPACSPSSGSATPRKPATPPRVPSCPRAKVAALRARTTCPPPRCSPSASTAARAAASTAHSRSSPSPRARRCTSPRDVRLPHSPPCGSGEETGASGRRSPTTRHVRPPRSACRHFSQAAVYGARGCPVPPPRDR